MKGLSFGICTLQHSHVWWKYPRDILACTQLCRIAAISLCRSSTFGGSAAYRENFYWPDLWAAREQEEKEKQAELDLQTKRTQVPQVSFPPMYYIDNVVAIRSNVLLIIL